MEYKYTGNTTNTDTSITNITTTYISVGITITGTGIPSNTIVTAISTNGENNDGTIIISNAATANGISVEFIFTNI